MKEDKIQILDDENKPMFQKQMTQFANYDSDNEE